MTAGSYNYQEPAADPSNSRVINAEATTNVGMVAVHMSPCPDESTIIVTGPARSGTSMISAMLIELGLFMGSKIDGAVYEDNEIGRALEAGDFAAIAEISAQRTQKFGRWGFKRPLAHRAMSQLFDICPNPRLIILFRDILAIAIRNNIAVQSDVLGAAEKAASEYGNILQSLSELPYPALLLSYEKCLAFPDRLVSQLIEFSGLSPSEDQIGAALALIEPGRPEYTRAARLKYQGRLDKVFGQLMIGWVYTPDAPSHRPNVVLYLDGKEVSQAAANIYRSDLELKTGSEGRCAFQLKVPAGLSGNELVEVRVQNSLIAIPGSGQPLNSYRSGGAPFRAFQMGDISGFKNGKILGWVRTEENDAQPELILYLDGEERGRVVADQITKDSAEKYEDCGFTFEVPKGTTGNEIVHIQISDSFFCVRRSGCRLRELDDR